MSEVKFNHSNRDGAQTLALAFTTTDGTPVSKIVTPANPSFAKIVTYLVTTPEDSLDVDHLHNLVDPAVGIGRMLQQEFGDRVTFDLHHFYLDGIPETSLLANYIKDKVLNGDTDWHRLVRFLVRLDNNPSKQAKNAVWQWVEKHGVTITEDGRMVGFKGLINGTDAVTGEENIPVSVHSGPNNFIDGVLYGEAGVAYQVPHRLGTVISKRRADVDDDTSLACSTGLHVGAYSYAKTFGENRQDGARYSTMGRTAASLPNSTFALVVFAPEAVVSVPSDGTSDWKIRVHEYEVAEFLDEVKDVLKDKPTYDVKTPAPFLPDGQEVSTDGIVPEDERPQPEPEVDAEAQEDAAIEQAGPWWSDVEDNVAVGDEPEAQAALEEEQDEAVLVEPEKGTGLLGRVVLRDWAAVNPALRADLEDTTQGHKAVARKWATITTEASVRRYRKSLEG